MHSAKCSSRRCHNTVSLLAPEGEYMLQACRSNGHHVAVPDVPGYQTCEHLQLTVLACIESLALRLRRSFLLPTIGMEDCCRLSWTSFKRLAMPLTSPDPPPAGKV